MQEAGEDAARGFRSSGVQSCSSKDLSKLTEFFLEKLRFLYLESQGRQIYEFEASELQESQ